MKLCIPIAVKHEGGMYTFIGNFMRWLGDQHIDVTASPDDDDYDVLFVNSWVVPASDVTRVKRARPGVTIVHRVDGSAEDYGGNPKSDRLQARVNLFADLTIFQSHYSRLSTREKFRVIAADGPVIFNPVDTTLFTPDGPRLELPPAPRVACASWSVNRRKGTWQIDQLAAAHPHVLFVLCGRFDGVGERPNVTQLGHLSHQRLAEVFRSCDVFLNLSENDPCPNVVLEAMASGLPVIYRASGGVPELVGECGVAIDVPGFGDALAGVVAGREALSRCARARVMTNFAPGVIFPKYLDAIGTAVRRREPSRGEVLRLAMSGYPVMPPITGPRAIAGGLKRTVAALVNRATSDRPSHGPRVGWVTYDSYPRTKRRLTELDSFTGMRVGNVARWMNHHTPLANEIYDPSSRYEVVVFQKMMDERCQEEATRIQAGGGKVVFDANVNYYDIDGDYFVPGTRPTESQRRDALRMTTLADWVVADSSNLERVIRPINPRVTWIPDNVDMSVYQGQRAHAARDTVRLIWSGIGKKAAHLLEAVEAFKAIGGAELVLVVDSAPDCLPQLQQVIPCRVIRFSDRRYAKELLDADIIISPKRLANPYELGHTEYKITLGMAVGLPAVASPQPSYIEAIGDNGGGIIAATTGEWVDALTRLIGDASLRAELGARARQTVTARYETSVVARQYLSLLQELIGVADKGTRAVHVQ